MWRAFIHVVMAFVLLAPVLGLAMDHHYMERLPSHTHLAPGSPAHIHAAGTPHSHELRNLPPAPLETIAAQDSSAVAGGEVVLPALLPVLALPGAGERFPFQAPSVYEHLLSLAVPPDTPPPRSAYA